MSFFCHVLSFNRNKDTIKYTIYEIKGDKLLNTTYTNIVTKCTPTLHTKIKLIQLSVYFIANMNGLCLAKATNFFQNMHSHMQTNTHKYAPTRYTLL